MRVLLSDGSGLTARQTAGQLAAAGHEVEVLSPDPICLARWTRHVRRVRRVPAYGGDPLRWLDAALAAARDSRADLLLPTQEQVAVLSARADLVGAAGVRTIVPPFPALRQVQDKLAAVATLTAVGLPQPDSAVLRTPEEALTWDRFPVYLKLPVGTASAGVWLARDRPDLAAAVTDAAAAGAFGDGGLLAQLPVAGPLAMVQAVFDDGSLIASHACLRVRQGAGGGASHKRGTDLPAVREHLAALGRYLGWHGALSADAILAGDGPVYIDLNPRLVEPASARQSGVDLVTPLVELALGARPSPQPPGRSGVATHQLLLAVLGAASGSASGGASGEPAGCAGGRRRVLAELTAAARQAGDYRGSAEELTPVRGDPLAAVPVLVAAAATLAWPPSSRWLSGGSVRNYSLSPEGWRRLRDHSGPG